MLRAQPEKRAGPVSAVWPLQCVDPRFAVAFGDRSEHADRCLRKAAPLPQVRKSERACHAQTSAVASSALESTS